MNWLVRMYLVVVITLTLVLLPLAFLLTYLFPIRFPRLIEAGFETYARMMDVYSDWRLGSGDRF